MGDEIRPFKIHVSEADLEDLKKRLRHKCGGVTILVGDGGPYLPERGLTWPRTHVNRIISLRIISLRSRAH